MHSVSVAALKLGVSERTLRKLVKSGRLDHHRIGVGRGTIRISDEAIARFLCDSKVSVEQGSHRAAPVKGLRHLKL